MAVVDSVPIRGPGVPGPRRTGRHPVAPRIASAAVLLVIAVAVAPSLGSRTTIVQQPAATRPALRIATANMHHLRDQWRTYAAIAARPGRTPHLILVQELWWEKGNRSGEISRFLRSLEEKTGRDYRYLHGDSVKYDPDDRIRWLGNAIVYDPGRLDPMKVRVWPQLRAPSCKRPGGGQIGVLFRDRQADRQVAAASVHTDPPCVRQNATRHAKRLDRLADRRHLTVLAGDFNARVDLSGQAPENGREATPDCWYRNISAAHGGGNDCGDPGPREDRYYDAIWLLEGDATNPAPESFCERFTRAAGGSGERDDANSCTDLITRDGGTDPDGRLDKSRIDLVWFSWERKDGSPRMPSRATAASWISYAKTDRSDDSAWSQNHGRYSDHRALFATVHYAR